MAPSRSDQKPVDPLVLGLVNETCKTNVFQRLYVPFLETTFTDFGCFSSKELMKISSFRLADDLLYNASEHSFYLFDGHAYLSLPLEDLKRLIFEFLVHVQKVSFSVTENKLSEFLRSLPYSLPKKNVFFPDKTSRIAFDDLTLDVHTFDFEAPSRTPPAFMRLPLPSTDLGKPTPVFDKYLETTFEHDPDIPALIPTLIGLSISPDIHLPMAFFFVGEGSNGKSVLLDLIKDIVTPQYVSATSLSRLSSSPYAAYELIGKRVNILSEEEAKYIEADRFKALVTGDMIQVERKYADPFSTQIRCRFLFSTNDTPTFKNLSNGLRRRIQIIPFRRTFSDEEQDRSLSDKLRAEIPGIVGKSLLALRKFLTEQKGIWRPTKSMEQAKENFINESSTALEFASEYLKVIPVNLIASEPLTNNDRVYEVYKFWANQRGYSASSSRKFWKDITLNLPGVSKESIARNSRRYHNIALIHDPMASQDPYAKLS